MGWTRAGKIFSLGSLGGNESYSNDVNDFNQIVGFAENAIADPVFGGLQTRAFLWENGVMRDIGDLGGPDAYAIYINDRGQIAGSSFTSAVSNPSTGIPTIHPFLWEKGKGMKDLGTLGGTIAQAVNGMNEGGEVVGATTMAGDQTHHPFLWDGKRLNDLGTFGGPNGEAAWINSEGDVVGLAQPTNVCTVGPGGGHAFLWRHGRLHDLGTTGGLDNSEADYINSQSQVVGYSFSCDLSAADAFLWEKGSIVDLNTLIPRSSGFYL